MKQLFTSHSSIPTYPPNINTYPNFYNCKESIFILNPGDMLYIPKGWFHWVFSYPDTNFKNLAISYIVDNYAGKIYNEFSYKKPYVFTLNKKENTFFNLSFEKLKQMHPSKKHTVFKSKKNTFIPVKKSSLKHNILLESLTFSEIETIKDFNLYIGQAGSMGIYKPPECVFNGFPDSTFKCFHWCASFLKSTDYIESGLHYDNTHNILIQISGKKLVRLYKPSDIKNMYLQPMYKI